MDSSWYDSISEWITSDGVRVIAIIVGALILYLFVRLFAWHIYRVSIKAAGDRMTEARERRLRTIAGVMRGMLVAVIVIVAVIMVLNELDYNVGPLLAGAGIVGVALGFGAQTLVKDLIGGYFVIMEGQFLVGDWIEVEGTSRSVGGAVEEIRMRTTLLRDVEGTLHIVPNGEIGIASNFNRGWARAVVDIDIYYKEDIDAVLKLLREACAGALEQMETAQYVTDGPEVLGVQNVTGRNVTVRIAARTEAFNKIPVARELRGLLVRELEKNGITLGRGMGGPV